MPTIQMSQVVVVDVFVVVFVTVVVCVVEKESHCRYQTIQTSQVVVVVVTFVFCCRFCRVKRE